MRQARKGSTFSVVILGISLGLTVGSESGCWNWESLDLGGCKFYRDPAMNCEAACLPSDYDTELICVTIATESVYLAPAGTTRGVVYNYGGGDICRGQTVRYFETTAYSDPVPTTASDCATGAPRETFGFEVYRLAREVSPSEAGVY